VSASPPGPEDALEKIVSKLKSSPAVEYGGGAMHCETTRLMTAVQAGDQAAFEDLVLEIRGRAFHVARSLVGSREDAMELCQESFMKVFRARASYNPTQPFLPWFHRILRNTCFSFLRKNKRIRKQSLSAQGRDGEEIEWEIIDPSPDPSYGAEQTERKLLFQKALERLSARDREILALRHFRELSYAQIATALEIPEGTVMSRLFHARRRLRETLGPLLGEISSNESKTIQKSKGAQ
jgi:RNA polymerase sigma-70 factor (ECF subfamily)